MTDSKGPRILYHSDGEYVLRSAYERACEGRNKWKEEYENLCKFANDFEAERDEFIPKYRNIELANKEMTRNDHVTFGDLLIERDRLLEEVNELKKRR